MAPSFPIGEPTTVDAPSDWKTQLPFDARLRVVNKIMETLKKHLPFSGPDGLNELRRIASRFEESVFCTASSQTEYLRKICLKMLSIEVKSQKEAGSSSSIPVADNCTFMDSGYHPMDNENLWPPLPNEEPTVNTGEWRTQLPPDSRQKNVEKITEALKKHVPVSEEGLDQLMGIADSFEELIFNTAENQVDYFRKVSFKIERE